MRLFRLIFILLPLLSSATIIDRIAVVVGNGVVKDSDIDRDIRVTAFLNGEPLDFSASARKKSAAHLIDQIFIRREIRDRRGYLTATLQETDRNWALLKSSGLPAIRLISRLCSAMASTTWICGFASSGNLQCCTS